MEAEQTELSVVDGRDFKVALSACGKIIRALKEDDLDELAEVLLGNSPYGELDNFIHYAGGATEPERPPLLENSHALVPKFIAVRVRETRVGKNRLIDEAFSESFPKREFLGELRELTGERIDALVSFANTLQRHFGEEGKLDVEGITRQQATNMANYLLDTRHPRRKGELLEAYQSLREGLISLGQHFYFLDEDTSN